MEEEPSFTNHLGQPVGRALPDWVEPPWPERRCLEGRFCQLEPLMASQHAEALFTAFAHDQDGRDWTYLPYGPFAEFDPFLEWVTVSASQKDPQFYAVITRDTGAAVGIASYLRITPSSGSIEVGHIHFAPTMQRKPGATEAMYLMMKHAFELGYRRYEWKCDALNAPSCAAAARLGLSFEGIFRQATIYKARSRDTAWFAAIDGEWPVLEQAFVQWLDLNNFDEHGQQRVSLRSLTGGVLKSRKH